MIATSLISAFSVLGQPWSAPARCSPPIHISFSGERLWWCDEASPCVWQWGLSAPWISGEPTGCWCAESASGCWWPLWSPAAPASTWSFWNPADRWPETPQSRRDVHFSSQRFDDWWNTAMWWAMIPLRSPEEESVSIPWCTAGHRRAPRDHWAVFRTSRDTHALSLHGEVRLRLRLRLPLLSLLHQTVHDLLNFCHNIFHFLPVNTQHWAFIMVMNNHIKWQAV